MRAHCTSIQLSFQALGRRSVVADFSGGTITTDAGGLLLREVAEARRLIERFAGCFEDLRDPSRVEHTVRELVAQRIYGIALGYEDLNDHEQLRRDPLLATLVGKLRSDPGARGLVTGNGWYLTKHSACVCASAPRDPAAHPVSAPALDDASTPVVVAEEASGRGTAETYTVLYDRDGAPTLGIVLGRLQDGRRFIANTPEDRDLLESFVGAEQVGREGDLAHVGGLNRFDPR